MIIFTNNNPKKPYKLIRKLYKRAKDLNQKNIEAISIASFSANTGEVESRFVNLKFVDDDKFIFFTNYESLKSKNFHDHDQISALLYWNKINTQIRIKAKISKTSIEYNKNYFRRRSKEKNALAISSMQSQRIKDFKSVKDNYLTALNDGFLDKCPNYWGGYSFTPYYFEFWQGNDFRINKRKVFVMHENDWKMHYLQP